jgi:hypothetical protein
MVVDVHALPVVIPGSTFTVAPLQASDAVGAVNAGEAVQSIVPDGPALPMVGGVLSIIVIV